MADDDDDNEESSDDSSEEDSSEIALPSARDYSRSSAKLTWYGYEKPWEADYDSKSAAGIGDHDNELTPLHSAALTESERLARFGVMGKSTGQIFEFQGMTLRDDDTAPESDRRVDVYSPAGPGRRGGRIDTSWMDMEALARGDYEDEIGRDPASLSDAEFKEKYGVAKNPRAEAAEQSDEPTQRQLDAQITPINKLRLTHPEFKDLTDDQAEEQLTKVFPDIPLDKLSVYAKQPGGMDLIEQEETKGLTPLQKFKKLFPDKAAAFDNDQELISYMHDQYEPKSDKEMFRQRVDPNTPTHNTFRWIGDQINAAAKATVEFGNPKQVEKFKNTLNPLDLVPEDRSALGQRLSAGANQSMAAQYNAPQAVEDLFAELHQRAGLYGMEKAANNWLSKNVPLYAGADNFYRQFAGMLHGVGKSYEARANYQAGQAQAQEKGDPVSTVTGEVAQGLGKFAFDWGTGRAGIGKIGTLYGMTFDGLTAYGAAVDNGQKNALLQGATAAGFRKFSSYMINHSGGRLASGLLSAFAAASEDEIGKFLRGEPNGIDTDVTHITAATLLALFNPKAREKSDYIKSPSELTLEDKTRFMPSLRDEPEAHALEPYKGDVIEIKRRPPAPEERYNYGLTVEEMAEKERLRNLATQHHGGYFSEIKAEPEFTFSVSKAVEEELQKAHQHLENGNGEKAGQHFDRAFALSDNGEKQEITEKFINKIDELTKPAHEKENLAEVGKAGDAIVKGMRDMLWRKFEQGVTTEAGGPSNVLRLAAREKAAGRITTRAQFEDFLNRYGESLRAKQPISEFAKAEASRTEAPAEPPAEPPPVPKRGEDEEFNDYYFSGLNLGPGMKVVRDWLAGAYEDSAFGRWGISVRKKFRPDILPGAQAFGQVVRSEEARSVAAQNQIPADIARANKIESVLQHGWRAEARDRYFAGKTEAERRQDLIDYQEGRSLKDPISNAIWEKVYRPLYWMIDQRERFYGIEHEARLNYFQQLFPHARDFEETLPGVAHGTGGPSFTKTRSMTYKEHLDRGDVPVTTNPERMLQMRWRSSEMAIQKIRDLRAAAAQGWAYNTKDPNIPPGIVAGKSSWIGPVTTANRNESYYVSQPLVPILKNKFHSELNLAKGWTAPFLAVGYALKGSTSGLLSWALFHPLHIMDIMTSDITANSVMRLKKGIGTSRDTLNVALNFAPWVSGVYHTTAEALRYHDEVSVLQGRGAKKPLTSEQAQNIKDFQDMGLVAEVSQERQMQFSEGMARAMEKFLPDPVTKLGAKILGMNFKGYSPYGWGTMEPFTKWWFGTVSPRLKFASAMMRRDYLRDTRPELFKASRRADLLAEYANVHRDIEGRFGELHYENLFWPKAAKQAGQVALLSLGWRLGFFRTMGDGLIDLTTNTAHLDEILNKAKTATGGEREWLSNRMAFEAAYVARAAVTGAAISALIGGVTPTIMDLFYPRVGKDEKGRDKRVNMQFFTKDIPSLMEYSKEEGSLPGGMWRMAKNWANPMANSVIQAMFNKDFMGRPIGNITDQVAYVVKQNLPISVQNLIALRKFDAPEIIAVGLGYTPSARWTMRNETENDIVQEAYHPSDRKVVELRDHYRQAFIDKDRKKMNEARRGLQQEGVDEKSIKRIEKDAGLSSAEKGWKHISRARKLQMLRQMPKEEQDYWLQRSSKPIQREFHHPMPRHPTTGLSMPRMPGEALALDPGTKFMDPYGRLRMVPQNA